MRDGVGEVELALGVVVGRAAAARSTQELGVEGEDPGVDLADRRAARRSRPSPRRSPRRRPRRRARSGRSRTGRPRRPLRMLTALLGRLVVGSRSARRLSPSQQRGVAGTRPATVPRVGPARAPPARPGRRAPVPSWRLLDGEHGVGHQLLDVRADLLALVADDGHDPVRLDRRGPPSGRGRSCCARRPGAAPSWSWTSSGCRRRRPGRRRSARSACAHAPRVGVEPTSLVLIQSQAGPAGRPTGDCVRGSARTDRPCDTALTSPAAARRYDCGHEGCWWRLQKLRARRRHRDLRAHRRRPAPAARSPGAASTPSKIGDMALLARDRGGRRGRRPRRARAQPRRRRAGPGRRGRLRARRTGSPAWPQVFVNHSDDVRPAAATAGPRCRRTRSSVMSERFRARLEALDADLRIVRLRQPIDTERLVPRRPPSEVPRRALLLGQLPLRRRSATARGHLDGSGRRGRPGRRGHPPDPAARGRHRRRRHRRAARRARCWTRCPAGALPTSTTRSVATAGSPPRRTTPWRPTPLAGQALPGRHRRASGCARTSRRTTR